MIEIGTVYHWCSAYLYRIERIDPTTGRVEIRSVGTTDRSDGRLTLRRADSTEMQPTTFEMFDQKHTRVYACARHGMMYF